MCAAGCGHDVRQGRQTAFAPPHPAVVATVGLAIGEHRHGPAAHSVLKAQGILRLAAGEPDADFLGLGSCELRALGGPRGCLQLANSVKQGDELVNLQKGPVGLFSHVSILPMMRVPRGTTLLRVRGSNDLSPSTEGVSMRIAGCPWLTRLGLVLTGIVLVSGCGNALGVSRGRTPRVVTSEPAALAAHAASDLLRHLVLPPGTARLVRLPSSVQGLLSQPAPSEPFTHIVDRHGFWISRESPAGLLAFAARHIPDGARLIHTGNLERKGRAYYWWEEFDLPTKAGALRPQRLSFAVADAGSHGLALRVDARVVWHPARPGDSLVPSKAKWLTVTVARPIVFSGHTRGPRVARALVVNNTRAVQTVVRAVNGLPVAEPTGPVPSCPAQDGEVYVWLIFREVQHGPALAYVQADPYDCGKATAWITIPGRPRLALTGSKSLIHVIEKAVGSRLEGLPAGS
jgi:hypothetical protein